MDFIHNQTKEIFDFDKYEQPSEEVWHEFDLNQAESDYEE